MKKMNKNLICILLSLLLVLSLAPISASAATSEPKIAAKSAILLNMDTGEVLYEKDADAKRYPASLTKMLTGILAIEYLDFSGTITCDDEAASTGGNSLHVVSGEVFNTEELVNAMMVYSANDAAVAVGKAVSGSLTEFAKLMNAKAAEFGATNSNFVNPHGLHNDEHYTTARDMAAIAMGCMQNATFVSIVCQSEYIVSATNKKASRTVESTNWLLNDEVDNHMGYVNGVKRYCKYEGVLGIKTGQTTPAGGCLVSACERDGVRLLSVVLLSDAYGRFADTIALFDWGFENYKLQTVLTGAEDMGTIAVHKGTDNIVGVELSGGLSWVVPTEASENILTTKVELDEAITAPFEKGTVVGKVTLYESGVYRGEVDIVTSSGMEEGGILSQFDIPDARARIIFRNIFLGFLLFVTLVAAFIVWRIQLKKRRRAAAVERRKAQLAAEKQKRFDFDSSYQNRYRNKE